MNEGSSALEISNILETALSIYEYELIRYRLFYEFFVNLPVNVPIDNIEKYFNTFVIKI